MLIEYMGNGFLDNIIALFRQDPSLCRFIPDMLSEENMRVRLGATALCEELAQELAGALQAAAPGLLVLLQHESPTFRGDAAYVLGITSGPGAEAGLRMLLQDENVSVREIARDALASLLR